MSRVLNVSSCYIRAVQIEIFLQFVTYTKVSSENSVLGSGELEKGLDSSFG